MTADFEFQLLRPKAKARWPIVVASVALAASAAWLSWSWQRVSVAERERREAEAAAQRLAAERQHQREQALARLGEQREAQRDFAVLRRQVPAWLDHIERCHPSDAQTNSVRVDGVRGVAIVELRSSAEFTSEAWVECLRKAGGGAVDWRLVEMRREPAGAGGPSKTLWVAEGQVHAAKRSASASTTR